MTTEATNDKYIIRRLSEIETERGVCGWRKTIVTHDDTPVANVSHLTIDNSRYHYHREMTEFYYVLTGGTLFTMGPLFARLAAELLTTGTTSFPVDRYHPARFGAPAPP